MNLVFHLVSALAATFLTLLILRLQRQRSFLLVLMQSGQNRARSRILVDAPMGFLARYAQACDLAFTPLDPGGCKALQLKPCRIDPAPWLELFLRCQPTLIECLRESGTNAATRTGLRVRIGVQGEAVGGLATRLAAALGEGVSVELQGLPQAAAPGA